MSELVQAMVVLATFHGLCSFVLGCGVAPEIDMIGGTTGGLLEESSLAAESVVESSTAEDTDTDGELWKQTAQLIHRLKKKNLFEEEAQSSTSKQSEVFENCESQESTWCISSPKRRDSSFLSYLPSFLYSFLPSICFCSLPTG